MHLNIHTHAQNPPPHHWGPTSAAENTDHRGGHTSFIETESGRDRERERDREIESERERERD